MPQARNDIGRNPALSEACDLPWREKISSRLGIQIHNYPKPELLKVSGDLGSILPEMASISLGSIDDSWMSLSRASIVAWALGQKWPTQYNEKRRITPTTARTVEEGGYPTWPQPQ